MISVLVKSVWLRNIWSFAFDLRDMSNEVWVSALLSLLFRERRLCIDGVDWLFLFVSCLTMFQDGIVNAGRLYVVYVFTQTYCAQYRNRVCDTWTAYNRVIEGMRCIPSSTNQQVQCFGLVFWFWFDLRDMSNEVWVSALLSLLFIELRLYQWNLFFKYCAMLRKWWTIWSVEWKTEISSEIRRLLHHQSP
jgi:hypothetical protein